MKKLILTICFLFMTNNAFGATQLLKTVKPSGGDYTSLEAALNANEQDLVAADKFFDVEISGDWTSTSDTTNVILHNYTMDATRFITIKALGDSKHDGTTGSAKFYVLEGAADITAIFLQGANQDYTIMQDFIMDAQGLAKEAIAEVDTLTGGIIRRMVIHNSTNTSSTIEFNPSSTTRIENLIMFNVKRGVYSESVSTSAKIYNSTIYAGAGSSFGILRVVAINCYVGNFATEDFFSLATGSDYNVSSDTSASDEATNFVDSQSTYADYFESITGGSEDFHLKNDSNSLWGLAGVDSSGVFTDDIDGDTRSAWDIGADEFVSVVAVRGQVIMIYD